MSDNAIVCLLLLFFFSPFPAAALFMWWYENRHPVGKVEAAERDRLRAAQAVRRSEEKFLRAEERVRKVLGQPGPPEPQ